jgi:hypothetical protein
MVAGGSLGTGCWAANDSLGADGQRSASQLGMALALGTMGYNAHG